MAELVYDLSIPPVIQAEIAEQLAQLEWLIPGWCQRVFIRWCADGDKEGTLIDCVAMYEYRKVYLTFYPRFLSQGERRLEDTIHDLLHCFSCVLADYADAQIKELLPEDTDPKFRASLLEEMRIRHESFVQDLAYCLAKKLRQQPEDQ